MLAEAAGLRLGLTICYDLRFPQLYRDLAQAGAEVLTRALGLHRADRAGRTGRCCSARARSRPAPSCWRRRSPGTPRRGDRARRGRPRATASRSRPGARCWPTPASGVGVSFVEIDPAEVARARGDGALARPRPRLRRRLSAGHEREPPRDPAVIALFSEIVMVEQLARTRLTRVLPRGMELSHFMVLNHFARLGGEKTPAQLAARLPRDQGAR